MSPLPNSTVALGAFTNHGDPDLFCTPSTTISILFFFLANFLAHCATVKSYPAETHAELLVAVVLALFFPSSGVIRALDSILRHSRIRPGTNDAQKAAKAGALCMVVRTSEWKPLPGDVIRDVIWDDRSVAAADAATGVGTMYKSVSQIDLNDDTEQLLNKSAQAENIELPPRLHRAKSVVCSKVGVLVPIWQHESRRTSLTTRSIAGRGCKVHGAIQLPPGYMLEYVPSDAKIRIAQGDGTHNKMKIEISSNYSVSKAGIAIAQTVNAGFTLYKARGDQLTHYGYAAFGLTVIPYIIMSILNLVAQAVTPDFPTFYLVHSEELEEARRRGGVFDGVVGSLVPSIPEEGEPRSTWIVKETINDRVYRLKKSIDSTDDSPDFLELDARPDEAFTSQELEDRRKMGAMPIPSCSKFDRGYKFNNLHTGSHWKAADHKRHNFKGSTTVMFLAPVSIGSLSIVLIYLLTRFQRRQSLYSQRAWTMAWLAVGIASGSLTNIITRTLIPNKLKPHSNWHFFWRYVGFMFGFGIFLVPAIGGFLTVGQMLMEYGDCHRLGD